MLAPSAGAGPGDGPLTRRPGLHHLRDLRTGQGGRPPPRLYRQAGLPPAAGHRRRHRRRADVPAARGPGQHRPRRRPLPAKETVGRVRYAGANGRLTLRADSGFYAHGVVSVCRQDGCPLLHHHPPAQKPAQSHRGDTKMPGRRFLTGWTAPPMWPRPPAPPSRPIGLATPVRLIVRRVKPTPGSQAGPLRQIQLSWLHHRPGGESSNWRLTIAATPRSRMPSETSSTVWG